MNGHYSDVMMSALGLKSPGGRLNKKDGLTRYGDSHVKDKTAVRKSPYVDKTVFILRRGPAYRLFPQPFVQAKTKESIKSRLWEGNPTVTCGFPSQRATNAKNVSIS